MEDDIFGTGTPKYTASQQMTLKEMARKANDRIRVYNPTDTDYTIRWDGIGFRVPNKDKDEGQGNGQAVFPRYIATNYVKHMADKILGERMIKAITEENQRREKGGMATMNLWQDRVQFDTQFRIDNPVTRGELISKILWLGIEEEYGLDMADDPNTVENRDTRTLDEQILANLERPAKRPTAPLDIAAVLPNTPVENQPPPQTATPEQLLQDVAA